MPRRRDPSSYAASLNNRHAVFLFYVANMVIMWVQLNAGATRQSGDTLHLDLDFICTLASVSPHAAVHTSPAHHRCFSHYPEFYNKPGMLEDSFFLYSLEWCVMELDSAW